MVEYCAESWCYVDDDKCTTRRTLSGGARTTTRGFYWSYDTCGGDSSLWTTDLIVKGLEGKVVRVAFPKSYPPMHYMVDDDGAPINSQVTSMAMAAREKGGVWFKYFDDIRETAGFEWEWTYTSQGARQRAGRLVLDGVRAGREAGTHRSLHRQLLDHRYPASDGGLFATDLLGQFLFDREAAARPNRHQHRHSARVLETVFEQPVAGALRDNCGHGNDIQLAAGESTRRRRRDTRPGRRDDGELRVVDSAAADDGARRAAPAHRPSLADSHYQGRTQRVLEGFESKHQSARVGHEELENSFHWFYVAAGEIMGGAINLGGQGDVPISIMILKIAWAFFALVVVALYTANLAAMFGQKQAVMHYPISNMDDCISMNPPCTVCGHNVIEDTIKQQYPQVNYKPLATGSSRLIAKMLGTWIPTGNEVRAEADDSTGCGGSCSATGVSCVALAELCGWSSWAKSSRAWACRNRSRKNLRHRSRATRKSLSARMCLRTTRRSRSKEHGCVPAEFDLGLPEVDEEAIAVLGVEHLSYLWVFLGCAMSVSLLADGYTRRYRLAKNSYAAVRPVVRRLSSVDGHGSSNEMPPGLEDDATSEASA